MRKMAIMAFSCLIMAGAVQAQTQTWDPDGNDVNDGGNGEWNTTSNFWDAGSTTWVNGNNAIFGSGSYQVDLTSAGVTVGDLTYGGGGTLEFKGSMLTGSAGDTITINSGGATWNTGGGEIEFFNDGNNNNTRLAMTSGDTLTVQGGGTFDTGQNPQNNANGAWQVGGATLDFQGGELKGHATSVGAFDTVKLGAGSTFTHERNANQSYGNDWELGGGTITFKNRWSGNGNITLSGSVSGNADEFVVDMNHVGRILTFTQADTTFTADTFRIGDGQVNITADNAISESVLAIGGISGRSARFNMLGNDQKIKGLYHDIGSTREIRNNTVGSTSVLTIDVDDGESYSYNANVNGGGTIDIVKTGDGTQIFNRNAGYTTAIGDLEVNGGELHWGVASGEIAGDVSVGASGVLQVGLANTVGTIDNKNVANEGEVEFNRTDAVNYSGVISGSGQVRLDSGVALTLGAAQTYEGQTILTKGTITATAANQLSADSVLNIGGGSGGTSAVDMGGYNQTIGGLTISGWNAREVRNNGADATLTLNVATGDYTYNANVAGTGTIDLIKTGAGTQTFGRNGGYTTALGDVTVSGGELVWNNNDAATQSGAVSVGIDGKLSGSGILGGAVTVAGALNPGNSPGTLTFNDDLTLESTATLTLEITGTDSSLYDILKNDGGDTLAAGGTLAFDVDTDIYTPVLDDTFTVFENWGGFSGSFNSITGTDLGGGLSLDTSSLLTDGTVTVIPEPAVLGLISIMGVGMLFVRRFFLV